MFHARESVHDLRMQKIKARSFGWVEKKIKEGKWKKLGKNLNVSYITSQVCRNFSALSHSCSGTDGKMSLLHKTWLANNCSQTVCTAQLICERYSRLARKRFLKMGHVSNLRSRFAYAILMPGPISSCTILNSPGIVVKQSGIRYRVKYGKRKMVCNRSVKKRTNETKKGRIS